MMPPSQPLDAATLAALRAEYGATEPPRCESCHSLKQLTVRRGGSRIWICPKGHDYFGREAIGIEDHSGDPRVIAVLDRLALVEEEALRLRKLIGWIDMLNHDEEGDMDTVGRAETIAASGFGSFDALCAAIRLAKTQGVLAVVSSAKAALVAAQEGETDAE